MQRAASTNSLLSSARKRGKAYTWVHGATGASFVFLIASYCASIPVLPIIFGVLFVIGLPACVVLGVRYVARANAAADQALRAAEEAKARYLQR